MANEIIKLEGVSKYYEQRKSMFSREKIVIKAINDISFSVFKGELVALVGESGSGKTTTGHVAIKLETPTKGKVVFDGIDIAQVSDKEFNKKYRTKLQMIFQDPYDYLDPEIKIFDLVAEPLLYNTNLKDQEIKESVFQIMKDVQLTPVEDIINRRPLELSGGQRQRILIARSLILNPEFVVADEPVSMLDASTQMGIVKVIKTLQEKNKTAILFITHDMALASYISKRIIVMYKGKIVEMSSSRELIDNPLHPYTIALIEALPKLKILKEEKKVHILPEKKVFSYTYQGCIFAERCLYANDKCLTEEPQLIEVENGHYVACFNYLQIKKSKFK